MSDLEILTKKIISFRDARDWKQFHNPKDIAISLTLESSELLELFQWKTQQEMEKYIKDNKNEISEELADCFYWILLASHDLNINIKKALENKLKKNAVKYPVEKSKGKHTKYTKL